MTKVVSLNVVRSALGKLTKRVYLRGLEAKAEGLSTRLARVTEVIDAASWKLDSALSALRKDAAGYRQANATDLDDGDSYTDGELEVAIVEAQALLEALEPARRLAFALVAADHLAALDGAACV